MIFYCSMLLYYPFWMFMGFTLHIYIIFGTNLLTGGPARIAIFFCLFQCFEEKEYQTESKRNETFGSVIFGTKRDPRDLELKSGKLRLLLDFHSKSSGSHSFQKSRSRRFHSVWTRFDIPFLQNTKIGKKTAIWAGSPVSRLVPKMI